MQAYSGVNINMDTPFTERIFKARDGETLFARHYSDTGNAQTTIIYLHGVTSKSAHLNTSTGLLLAQIHADIITPDLRGHDRSGGPDFDIDYIGQYEDNNAPQDSQTALQAIKAPLLVLVGEKDEMFVASAYDAVVRANSKGHTIIVPNLNHNQLLNDASTFEHVAHWYETLN